MRRVWRVYAFAPLFSAAHNGERYNRDGAEGHYEPIHLVGTLALFPSFRLFGAPRLPIHHRATIQRCAQPESFMTFPLRTTDV